MSTTVVSRNSWRLVSKLGSGTFGSVWYAVHYDLDSVCAVKVVSTATFLRFKQRTSTSLTESSEFNTLRALEHPHVQGTLGYEADTDFVRVYLYYLHMNEDFLHMMCYKSLQPQQVHHFFHLQKQ